MKYKIIICFCFFTFLTTIGSLNAQRAGSYYKIEDIPGELTKKINLWGYINSPGRYEVPISTNLIQLVTYAGGPKDHALMDEIKVYRLNDDGTRRVIEIDLEDPEEASEADLNLYNEDTIYIDFSSVISWREAFSLISGPLAAIASLVLIIDRLATK